MSNKPFWELIEKHLGKNFAENRKIQSSVKRLSRAFTEDREDLPSDYLEDPDLGPAYLAYFVPLNFEKVYAILSSHAGVWPKQIDHPQRWVDFGSGPGTATLAALLAYRKRYKKLEKLPVVHIDLIDAQASALEKAIELVRDFAAKLNVQIELNAHPTMSSAINAHDADWTYDLAFAANVLNELPGEDSDAVREMLLQVWDATSGVFFLLEPGHRVSSQRLVRFRERMLKDGGDFTILGPCPHTERCPVYRSKHWCHFSEPVTDGRLIDLNLRIFKDPRGWLKFSYLLVKRGERGSAIAGRYRAIGDLHQSGPKNLAIDLCQPNEKFVLRVPKNIPPELRRTLVRGSVVNLDDERKIDARPMTKRTP